MEEEEPRHHQEQRLHMPRLGRESALPLHTGPERKEGQLMSEGALPRDAKGGDNSRPREKGRWEGRAMTGRGWGGRARLGWSVVWWWEQLHVLFRTGIDTRPASEAGQPRAASYRSDKHFSANPHVSSGRSLRFRSPVRSAAHLLKLSPRIYIGNASTSDLAQNMPQFGEFRSSEESQNRHRKRSPYFARARVYKDPPVPTYIYLPKPSCRL
jgi:hypothetical protein